MHIAHWRSRWLESKPRFHITIYQPEGRRTLHLTASLSLHRHSSKDDYINMYCHNKGQPEETLFGFLLTSDMSALSATPYWWAASHFEPPWMQKTAAALLLCILKVSSMIHSWPHPSGWWNANLLTGDEKYLTWHHKCGRGIKQTHGKT